MTETRVARSSKIARRSILVAAVLAASAASAETSPSAKETIGAAQSAVLQADGRRARELLAKVPAEGLEAKDAAFRDCALARLDGPVNLAAPTDVFAAGVLALYRAYWRQSVMTPEDRDAAVAPLRQGLARLLGEPDTLELDAALAKTKARLEQSGFHAINGRTGRLLDLIMWSRQDVKDESVELPEGGTKTRVFYLDDFQSRGWSNYLTCDSAGTGGWATREGLYIIVPAYKSLADESFTVSFLGHESQHYADYDRLPGLKSWELEYRAKLVELAYADASRERLLGRFAGNQGDDPGEAHSYANRRVLVALREKLGLPAGGDLVPVPADSLKQGAVALLREDTAGRKAAAP